jgi:mono/diheme cytochrome c family protein
MKRVLRWLAYGLGGLVTIVVFAALGGFVASEMMIRRTFPKPQVQLAATKDPGAVERGRKIAVVTGCHDCHGDDMSGKLFHDEPMIVRAWGPNLTLAAAKQTDAELARAIRHGVAADGRSLWVMPSDALSRLTDTETADLLAYVRSFPVRGEVQPALQVGPLGRVGLLTGKFNSAPANLAKHGQTSIPHFGPQHAQGRELARNCMECHGLDLKGGFGPDLTIAAAYDAEQFETLLRTGIAPGGRKLGLMTQVSPARFNVLTDQEIAALHGYLKRRAETAS